MTTRERPARMETCSPQRTDADFGTWETRCTIRIDKSIALTRKTVDTCMTVASLVPRPSARMRVWARD